MKYAPDLNTAAISVQSCRVKGVCIPCAMRMCEFLKCVIQAGRGPLAGPVVAAACVVPRDVLIEGIHDSKKLAEPQREALYDALTSHPRVQYAVSIVDHAEIDNINILQVDTRTLRSCVHCAMS